MNLSSAALRPQNIARGVTLVILAGLTISLQDVVFKLFSSALSLWQIFSVRALLAFPMLFALAWMGGIHRHVLRDALRGWVLLRALYFTLTFMAFYAALPFLSLSTIGAAVYMSPIFVTLLSAYVIREAVGLLGWVGVVIGFVGVLVLLQPGSDAFSYWAILPLLGAGFYALAHITTRSKCQSVPLATMALSLNIVMLLAGLIVSAALMIWPPNSALVAEYPNVFGGWSPIGLYEWQVLGLLALFVVVIAVLLAGAYQAAPPAIVATFEYSYLLFAVLWDVMFFANLPSVTTLAGMALIIAAGLMVLRRSRLRPRAFPRQN